MAAKPERPDGATLDQSRWLFAGLSIGAVIYVFVGAWVITAGPADPVAHTAAFLAHLVSPWMLASYVVAVAFIGYGLWYLQRVQPRAGRRDIERVMQQTGIRLVLVLMMVSVSVSAIGWLYIRDIEQSVRAERARQLELVARLDARTIGQWLIARSVDSERLAGALARLPIERLAEDRQLARGIELLFAEMLAGNPERVAVTLFSADGAVLAHAGSGGSPDAAIAAAARALAAAPSTAARIVDLYNAADRAGPRMGFLAPVAGRDGPPARSAVAAVTIDPFHGLLDQLPGTATAGAASTVVVVRRDDKDVVFVTPPRLTPAPAPNSYRLPLADANQPVVQAVQRGDGVYYGQAADGTQVVAAAQRVNGVPWIVVAEGDEAALRAPLKRRQDTLVLVIGAAIVLAAVMLLVLWRAEYAALRTQDQLVESERTAMTQHFAQLTRLARDIVLMLDPDGRIIEANDAAVAAYGYSQAELYHLSVADLRTTEELPSFDRQWRAGVGPQGVLIETVHRRKDGSSFPVEISGRVIEVEGRPYRQAFIRDISARKKLEREVERLSQVRSALQSATSVLLRARDEHELYRNLCKVLVRFGAYRAAYVGEPVVDAQRSVRFIAVEGIDDGYLDRAGISWGDGPRGGGPTGVALRTGEIRVEQNLATSPAMAPWRDEATQRGAHACIGLPLKLDGQVYAALTIHALQPDAFDPDEVGLLAALAEDIAFTVARLRG